MSAGCQLFNLNIHKHQNLSSVGYPYPFGNENDPFHSVFFTGDHYDILLPPSTIKYEVTGFDILVESPTIPLNPNLNFIAQKGDMCQKIDKKFDFIIYCQSFFEQKIGRHFKWASEHIKPDGKVFIVDIPGEHINEEILSSKILPLFQKTFNNKAYQTRWKSVHC